MQKCRRTQCAQISRRLDPITLSFCLHAMLGCSKWRVGAYHAVPCWLLSTFVIEGEFSCKRFSYSVVYIYRTIDVRNVLQNTDDERLEYPKNSEYKYGKESTTKLLCWQNVSFRMKFHRFLCMLEWRLQYDNCFSDRYSF